MRKEDVKAIAEVVSALTRLRETAAQQGGDAWRDFVTELDAQIVELRKFEEGKADVDLNLIIRTLDLIINVFTNWPFN